MTLNLKPLAFFPYVSLFSVICIVDLATFGNFLRRLRRKEPDLRAAGKNFIYLLRNSGLLSRSSSFQDVPYDEERDGSHEYGIITHRPPA